ncbi:MAG: hypothetical protein QM747_18915 [Nocardioides sp.]
MSHRAGAAAESLDRPAPAVLAPGSPVRTAFLVIAAYAVVGALAGVVWEWVWTPPRMVAQQHQLYYASDAALRGVFTGTGVYVLVAVAASALLALATCLLTRGRELLVLVLLLAGSAVAAALMWRVGTMLGPGNPATVAAHTTATKTLHDQLTVSGKSPYLAWPMTSLFVLAIVYFAWPGSVSTHTGAHDSRGDDREADTSSSAPG